MSQVIRSLGAIVQLQLRRPDDHRRPMPSVDFIKAQERSAYRRAVAGSAKRADKLLRKFTWERD